MADAEKNKHWLELYREAVLEPDRSKIRARVARARRAIRSRARELWYSGSPVTNERSHLDAAADLLGILRAIGDEE